MDKPICPELASAKLAEFEEALKGMPQRQPFDLINEQRKILEKRLDEAFLKASSKQQPRP